MVGFVDLMFARFWLAASAKVWLLCTNSGTDDFSVDHLLINFSRLGGPACAGKVSSGSDWGKVFTRF